MKMDTIRSKKNFKPDLIEIRPAQLDDLEEICRLLEADHMNDGVHNLKIPFLTSAPTITVAVVENKVIGVDAAQILHIPEGIITFVFLKGILPAYRGLRISRQLVKPYLQYPGLGYQLPNAIKTEPLMRKFGHKLLTYSGNPTIDKLVSFHDRASTEFEIIVIKDLAELDGLVAYDRTVFDYDRGDFMRLWCEPSNTNEPYVRTVVAKQGVDVIGFGSLRFFPKSYNVQPLYANNDAIASAILLELVRLYMVECDVKKPFTVMFFATNRVMLEFVRKAGLSFEFSFVQGFADGTKGTSKIAEAVQKYIRMDRVYFTQYYWPV